MIDPLLNDKTRPYRYLIFTDLGADLDDAVMLAEFERRTIFRHGLEHVIVFCSGDTLKRKKVAEHILHNPKSLMADCGPMDQVSLEFEFDTRKLLQFPCEGFKQYIRPENDVQGYTWKILIAAPMVGIDLKKYIKKDIDTIEHVVYVGDDPRKSKRGLNGGARYETTVHEHINQLLCELEDFADEITFLPPEITRQYPLTTHMLHSRFGPYPKVRRIVYEVVQKFLLGDRPSHLGKGLQLRCAEANLQSLCKIIPNDSKVEIMGKGNVSNDSIQRAINYCFQFDSDTLLIDLTSKIFECQKIIGHDIEVYTKQHLERSIPLLPKYDFTGLIYLIDKSLI